MDNLELATFVLRVGGIAGKRWVFSRREGETYIFTNGKSERTISEETILKLTKKRLGTAKIESSFGGRLVTLYGTWESVIPPLKAEISKPNVDTISASDPPENK